MKVCQSVSPFVNRKTNAGWRVKEGGKVGELKDENN